MLLQQVIELARDSEMRDLNVKDDIDAVLGYINLGMIELYKRFTLKVNEHLFELEEGVSIYTMPSDFMWVFAAYGTVIENDEYRIQQLAINEEDSLYSINTVGWNQVQVSQGIAGSPISIIYAAAPKYLSPSDIGCHIELPPQMLEALLAYVGYRAYNQIPGTAQSDIDSRYAKFKRACDEMEIRGMVNGDDLSMPKRLQDRGFQ